jgi:tetratricopeptide (TPR) repeat protein
MLPLPLAAQGNYQAPMQQARETLCLDPTSDFGWFGIGWTDIQAGNISPAIPELQKAYEIGSQAYVAGLLGYAYAATGERTRARAVIDELHQESSRRFISSLWPAIIYLGLGDRQRSLEGLERAYQVRDPCLGNLKIDSIYDPLRSDPRFIELLRKVGLDR